jgi:RNA polymerase sigma factor (sigma-70 family)
VAEAHEESAKKYPAPVSYSLKSIAHQAMSERKSDDAGVKAAPPDSIESLYTTLESCLLLYAQTLVNHDAETAQDIVQEAFMRLHADYAEVRQPQAWLYRTVHNLAMNHLRAGRKIVPLATEETPGAEPADTQPLPDAYLERMEAIGQTRLCLEELNARSRELVRLKFEEGLSYKEISERTQLSISNVGYLLHHALRDLGDALKRAGVAP